MGCDGGTIPKRHELVKGPKKVEKVRPNYTLIYIVEEIVRTSLAAS